MLPNWCRALLVNSLRLARHRDYLGIEAQCPASFTRVSHAPPFERNSQREPQLHTTPEHPHTSGRDARPKQPGARPSHQPPRGRKPHLMKPSALTASYSSWRALMLWSIPARVASEISRPSTTCHSPPSEVTGKPKFRAGGDAVVRTVGHDTGGHPLALGGAVDPRVHVVDRGVRGGGGRGGATRLG